MGMAHISLETAGSHEKRPRMDNAAWTRCSVVIRSTRANSARNAASALALRRCGRMDGFGSDMWQTCVNPCPAASPELGCLAAALYPDFRNWERKSPIFDLLERCNP